LKLFVYEWLAWFKQHRFWVTLICGFIVCGNLKSEGFGWMVTPLLELCHPQAALEAATQD